MFKNLEKKEIDYILENNYIGQLGYIFNNKPFVVPITYFFDKESNTIICYSGDGHKMNAMRKNPTISLLVSDVDSVTNWKSILVHGTFEQHFASNAKAYLHKFSLGIKDIIMEKEQNKANFISDFSSKIYKDDIPAVFVIKIEEITGKKRLDFKA
ncbi:pyridoxamine 5'-phosphate oxidase family protein [Lacinutrix sp. C3R15]|uniref:pyridoxamine 5'-phosphate oxidase family protein n=1 Tax=Flavobacteriaceae TaxID=49546 RepID=UPI001C0883FE|nr:MULTISPECIES: pyridoxamine 5'-phosphate oxidase family protein [Flavobacteriaceae]MBU2939779.1 pyridoxamine 5'-phosphate oxidase family protein [Lacinutrix sp. C3R15]MDO6623094.1 pyridoxamine 5'-phosphate oxidase family protein [Oceanihabitans sp. 1_MG-2023]